MDFVDDIAPEIEPDEIAGEFLAFARKNLPYPALVPLRQARRSRIRTANLPKFKVHVSKFTARTIYALAEMGLVENPAKLMRRKWITLDFRTAAIYMTFLAERMAERRALPVVTDDPRFQSLVTHFQFDRKEPNYNGRGINFSDPTYALASVVIKTAVPHRLESIPLERIIAFRKAHEPERRRFYDAIEKLTSDVPPVQDERALTELIEHHRKGIQDAADGLNRAMAGVGITTIAGILGISLPPWLASELQRAAAPVSFFAGAVSVYAALNVGRHLVDCNNLRRNSPWSYVLSLRTVLKPRNLIEQLISGEIVV